MAHTQGSAARYAIESAMMADASRGIHELPGDGPDPGGAVGACESSIRPARWASEDDHDEAHKAYARQGHSQAA